MSAYVSHALRTITTYLVHVTWRLIEVREGCLVGDDTEDVRGLELHVR